MSLSNYTTQPMNDLFDRYGVFFAFSNEQYAKSAKQDITYVSLGGGMIAPKEHAQAVIDGLNDIHKAGVAQDIAENGIKAIIHRELANHEAQITGDISDTVDALASYNITEKQIRAEFRAYMDHCIEHDLF